MGVPVATFFQVSACRCCRCCGTASGQDNRGVKAGQGVLGAAGGWSEPMTGWTSSTAEGDNACQQKGALKDRTVTKNRVGALQGRRRRARWWFGGGPEG